jgi:hypothetical protein
MRRGLTRTVLLTMLFGCGLSGQALAQNREKAWEIAPYAGFVKYGASSTIEGIIGADDTAEITIDDDATFGFRFGYHLSKRQMVEFGFSTFAGDGTIDAVIDDVQKDGTFSADILSGRVNYVLNFFLHRRDKVVAYVTGGMGAINFSTFGQSSDPDIQDVLSRFVGDETHLMLNYGGGIRLFGGERTGVRFDVRQIHYDTDDRGREDYIELSAAVTIILGGA